MTLLPLLIAGPLALALAPPADANSSAAPPPTLTGAALRARAAAELEAALDAPLAAPLTIADGDLLTEVLRRLLPGQVVRPDSADFSPPRPGRGRWVGGRWVAEEWHGARWEEATVGRSLSLPAGPFPTRVAVTELLRRADGGPLTFHNDGGVLRVTTANPPADRPPPLAVRLYPVADLLAAVARAEGVSPRAAAARLIHVVKAGTGGESPPGAPPGALPMRVVGERPWNPTRRGVPGIALFNAHLVVRQTDAVHREIAALLDVLRASFLPPQADPEPTE